MIATLIKKNNFSIDCSPSFKVNGIRFLKYVISFDKSFYRPEALLRLTGLAEKIIQTIVTMDPSPKTVELHANKIQRN